MSALQLQRAVLQAVAGMVRRTGVEASSIALKTGVTLRLQSQLREAHTLFLFVGDEQALASAIAHTESYLEAQLSEAA